ncbi:hypothetical protein [Tropicimonas aquimaris]|uniref:Uncharacterized protein n=1 Tax=Tropicimonas aquimaris TaxID=914152 RepID=A0ABW3ISK9_9RHOB
MKRKLTAFGTALLASALLGQAPPGLAADVFVRTEPAAGHAYPDYFCTNRGVRVDVEELSCLTVDGRSFEAKCDISLNNPMWRATGNACEPGITSEIHAVLPN